MLVVAVLLCLGVMNIAVRATWTEMDDGVLWRATASDLVAREVAEDSPAARAGVRAGDILLQVDGVPVTSPEDVVKALLAATGCGELGTTSPDGRFTVIEVECLGACGFPTPILIDDDFIENVTPETVPGLLQRYA